MIAKIWKKVLLFVLIIACLFNIVNKIVHKSFYGRRSKSFCTICARTTRSTKKTINIIKIKKK